MDNVQFHLLPLDENFVANLNRRPDASDSFTVQVTTARDRKRKRTTTVFNIQRSIWDFMKLDKHLHSCEASETVQSHTGGKEKRGSGDRIRLVTNLPSLENILDTEIDVDRHGLKEIESKLREYLVLVNRAKKTSPIIRCNKLLKWFCLDHLGGYCNAARKAFNEPGVLQGECVHEYDAKCRNEMDMRLRDQIIVTRVCAPWESLWWFGKNIGGGQDSQLRSMTVSPLPALSLKLPKLF